MTRVSTRVFHCVDITLEAKIFWSNGKTQRSTKSGLTMKAHLFIYVLFQ